MFFFYVKCWCETLFFISSEMITFLHSSSFTCRAHWTSASSIPFVPQTTLTGEEPVHFENLSGWGEFCFANRPPRLILQTKLLCDHHGEPRDPLQHGHSWGDAPLDRPAAEVQGRLQGRRAGLPRQRFVLPGSDFFCGLVWTSGSMIELASRRLVQPSPSGWLHKEMKSGAKSTSLKLKKRWFVLTTNSLDYYKSSERSASKLGTLVLNSLCSVVQPDEKVFKDTGQFLQVRIIMHHSKLWNV